MYMEFKWGGGGGASLPLFSIFLHQDLNAYTFHCRLLQTLHPPSRLTKAGSTQIATVALDERRHSNDVTQCSLSVSLLSGTLFARFKCFSQAI